MFSLAALNVIGSSSLRLSRSFSSSTVNWFPKLKTHQGAKKRWKALSNSGFKRVCMATALNNPGKSDSLL